MVNGVTGASELEANSEWLDDAKMLDERCGAVLE